MVEQDREADADRLSAAALKAGDPTGWFEQLYAEAAGGQAIVPWDRGEPHPLLVEWADQRPVPPTAHRTLVVGSGLGEDAAYLSRLGWGVIAFDISPSAIATARHRFPATPVDFRVADVLDPPKEWTGHFDLVLESYTTQALPVRLRPTVIKHVARFVAPGGTLLVLAAGRDERPEGSGGVPPGSDAAPAGDGPPWPLSRSEVSSYAAEGLTPVALEELGTPADIRWRAEFTRGRL